MDVLWSCCDLSNFEFQGEKDREMCFSMWTTKEEGRQVVFYAQLRDSGNRSFQSAPLGRISPCTFPFVTRPIPEQLPGLV